MKQTKREYLVLHAYYDRTGMAEHLEKMAAKGWLLEKIGPGGWQYRRTEPKQLRFSVVYFPRATQFDPGPTEQLETFRDFCAEAGWVLAADTAQMQVFYHTSPDAVPIETDPGVQLKNIHQAMKRSFLGCYWSLLALSVFQTVFSIRQFWQDPIAKLSSTVSLTSLFAYIPALILVSTELTRYYDWRRRAKAAVETGAALPELRSPKTLNLMVIILAAAELIVMFASTIVSSRLTAITMALMLLFMVFIILLTNTAQNAMKHLHFKAWLNRTITYGMIIGLSVGVVAGIIALVFAANRIPWLDDDPPAETYEYKGHRFDIYHDQLPLAIQDLAASDYDQWSTHLTESSSPLLTHVEATQRPRMDALDEPDLEYEVVLVKAGFLYKLCQNQFIHRVERWNDETLPEFWDEYRPVDAAPWNAEAVYQLYTAGESRNQFLICWPDRMAEVTFDWSWIITPETASITAEALQNI